MKTANHDFSYTAYRELIREYLYAGYRFGTFCEFAHKEACDEPVILMRHDIDFSLKDACQMAALEHQEGVQSTYFLLLRTVHYNVLSKRGTDRVRRILELGHRIGLQFDCAAYPEDLSDDELAEACRREASILSAWFMCEINVVSYHRPSPRVLSGNPALSAPLPHTYGDRFMKRMKYCSDSRGAWHYGDPRSLAEFHQRKPMHVLVHPVWWSQTGESPAEKLNHWLTQEICEMEASMVENCAVYRLGSEVGTSPRRAAGVSTGQEMRRQRR